MDVSGKGDTEMSKRHAANAKRSKLLVLTPEETQRRKIADFLIFVTKLAVKMKEDHEALRNGTSPHSAEALIFAYYGVLASRLIALLPGEMDSRIMR